MSISFYLRTGRIPDIITKYTKKNVASKNIFTVAEADTRQNIFLKLLLNQ